MTDTSPGDLHALFDAVAASEDATALDVALGRTLARLDPARGRELALGAALVSVQRRRGHSAVRLADWPAFPGTALRLPDADAWAAALRASPAVAADALGPPRPLVLDAGGRLSFFRDRAAEARLADAFTRLAEPDPAPLDAVALAPAFAALFPDATGADQQAVAAVAALAHRLAVVVGGPGTGKTTTVVRLLALLLAARPGLRVALAAPTGKAAHRLGESIAAQAAGLPDGLGAAVPTTATTLHRLLDASPAQRRFRRTAARPLAVDVVVVDEGSMVDLGLFDALVAALRPGARLVVLGDRDQLPSVEAGAVLADLAQVVGPDARTADLAAALGLADVPDTAGRFGGAVVRLERTYRYAAGSGLGALARALRDGDAAGVREALATASDVEADAAADLDAAVWARLGSTARALCDAAEPADALALTARVRLLAPTRGGRRGVHALNRLVERRLLAEGLRPPGPWYHGRPILVTSNDHDRHLYNGDVGVVWDPPGRRARPTVVFEGVAGGPPREMPTASLPEHETAWATTVHKSQGSEFEQVVVVLPEAGSAQAARVTRELAYTAVTRARGQRPGGPVPLAVLGPAAALADAAARPETRVSTLAESAG